MSKFTCKLCQKNFSTKYSLERHMNKKIPCNNTLECERCKQIFAYPSLLKRHLNKKIPCKKFETTSVSENNFNLEKKLEYEKEKSKIRIKEKKEIIAAKKEAELAIVREKAELRKITQINNTQINNITNNIYIKPPDVTTECYNRETLIKFYNNVILHLSIDNYDAMFSKCTDMKELIVKLLKYTYNNDNYPEFKNIIYLSDIDRFYTIDNMDWRERKFPQICDILLETIKKYFNEFGPKGINNEECIGVLYKNMNQYFIENDEKSRKTRKKDIKECATTALQSDDINHTPDQET